MKTRNFTAVIQSAALCLAMAAPLIIASAPVVRAKEAPRQITVSGEGRVAAVPDMATINLGVTHQAREAGDAMTATSDATARMLKRLVDLGVAPRDLQTSSLSLNPVWSNRGSSGNGGEAKITGFVASNSVMVRLRDLSELGRILDAVIADGANDFNGLQFSVQEPDRLMNEARQKAVADAMAKAQLFSTAAGVTLGPVQSIAEQGGGRPMRMEMAAARMNDLPIAAGEVSISASVSMVFAIID